MISRVIAAILISMMAARAQSPLPNSFVFSVPLNFTVELNNYDIVSDEKGMHIVYPSGSSIRHVLVGASGLIIIDTIIATYISGPIRPSISTHRRNGVEELNVAYRNADSIYIRRSTDGGRTWLIPLNASTPSWTSASTDRLQMAAEGIFVHVTWDTGTDQEVLYSRYDLERNTWDGFYNVTDENNQTGDTIIAIHGSYPDIALSEKNGTKRVHVVFKNERWIENPICSHFPPTQTDSLQFSK